MLLLGLCGWLLLCPSPHRYSQRGRQTPLACLRHGSFWPGSSISCLIVPFKSYLSCPEILPSGETAQAPPTVLKGTLKASASAGGGNPISCLNPIAVSNSPLPIIAMNILISLEAVNH